MRRTPLSFVACDRKAAILRVQIWSAHESDVVGLCTGFSETMTAEKAQALGIDAFCLKPFVLQDLGHTIRRVLRQRRDRGEGPKEVQEWFTQ